MLRDLATWIWTATLDQWMAVFGVIVVVVGGLALVGGVLAVVGYVFGALWSDFGPPITRLSSRLGFDFGLASLLAALISLFCVAMAFAPDQGLWLRLAWVVAGVTIGAVFAMRRLRNRSRHAAEDAR